MPREVADADGITWTCIQAFAGLGNDPEKVDAARVHGDEGLLQVVCTPSGGAKSVRIEVPPGWEEGLSDAELIETIRDGAKPNGGSKDPR